jgi:hypothetical protein
MKKTNCFLAALIAVMIAGSGTVAAQPKGKVSSWHGFDRYDYVISEAFGSITPVAKTEAERMGVAAPEAGTHRAIVVAPKQAAPGNPVTWRGCYWDHEPQSEIELLKRGFHVVYAGVDPGPAWDAWWGFITSEWKLSPKTAFIGMSRGGSNAYTWATNNPDKVFAIYADNPGLGRGSLQKLHLLAAADVPLLNVCGSTDPILQNTWDIEKAYQAAGGRISILLKDGPAHHPHSLRDPGVVADFIEGAFTELSARETPPEWLPERYTRSWFYGTVPEYAYIDSEKVWASKWGPEFGGAYRRYSFSADGLGRLTVFAPCKAAPGMPWVWRADFPETVSTVDLGLLAQGYHIAVGPVPTNFDGPVMEDWDKFYAWLTARGFASRVVMAGRGAATGEVYVWAERNPDKVALVYGENPIMRASAAAVQPIDGLKSLAGAGVPILHVSGALDPNLESQTRETEKRYRALKGKMTVIVDPGRGHYPTSPSDPATVIETIGKLSR